MDQGVGIKVVHRGATILGGGIDVRRLGSVSDMQIEVRADGSIVIPSEQVADLGFKPGEQVAVSLVPRSTRHSFGILRGKIPNVEPSLFESAATDCLRDFEARRGL